MECQTHWQEKKTLAFIFICVLEQYEIHYSIITITITIWYPFHAYRAKSEFCWKFPGSHCSPCQWQYHPFNLVFLFEMTFCLLLKIVCISLFSNCASALTVELGMGILCKLLYNIWSSSASKEACIRIDIKRAKLSNFPFITKL